MFSKVLVANRGEIALRVIRCLRELGVRSVAVASEPEHDAPHALAADERRILGPGPASQSYLSVDRVIAAARDTGAQAVHPGYGFLSENPDLAAACAAEGIVFVGPPVEAIRIMGSKTASRDAAVRAGVPVVPGIPADDDRALLEGARGLGWPVLIKAAAGGGGKGMRVVAGEADFLAAAALARGEAEAAFGDGTLYVERYLARPRHVEIQVFGDAAGRIFPLGERECSVQRRHQKILEECPSPAVDPDLRRTMEDAAVRIAAEVSYRGAGTVEFLLAPDGGFYFLEMNTRLQVEHPVTELVYGVDLVASQILTAAGEALPFDPDALSPRGHAVEARIYAEDPARGFLPQTGTVHRLRLPERPGVRVDAGLREGQEVLVHYDPLLAKISAWGPDRENATRRLHAALGEFTLLGVVTNVDFLRSVLELPAWNDGRLHTGFLEEHLPAWEEPAAAPLEAAAAAALALAGGPAAAGGAGNGRLPTSWETLGPWSPGERT